MDFTSISKLQNEINKRIAKAVEQTSIQLCKKLKEIIQDQYYDMYEPRIYERTFQFLNSVSMEIINSNYSVIYLDNYGSYKDATMQYVQELASSGFHGRKDIQTDGRYWEVFLEYVSNNAVRLLEKNMHEQGL